MQGYKDEREMAEIKRLEKNRVIVRLWISTHKDGKFDSIGHISVETQGRHYISLWPVDPHVGLKDTGKVFPFYLVKDIDEDCSKEREGRPPDRVYCFYKLNVLAINTEFEAFKEDPKGWTMIPMGAKTCGAESCISLARRVLVAGDFSNYVSKFDKFKASFKGSSKASSGSSTAGMLSSGYSSSSNKDRAKHYFGEAQVEFVRAIENFLAGLADSPDGWMELLEMARKAEREQHPETKSMVFKGETFPPYPKQGFQEPAAKRSDSVKVLRK